MRYRCPSCGKDESLYESHAVEGTGYYPIDAQGARGRFELDDFRGSFDIAETIGLGCGDCAWEGAAFEKVREDGDPIEVHPEQTQIRGAS